MPNNIIKGSLSTIILQLIEERGRMYGYEITRTVREKSHGMFTITEAALYPALKKLEEQGLLETETEPADGRIRKYYKLSNQGYKVAHTQLESLRQAMLSLQQILNLNLSKM